MTLATVKIFLNCVKIWLIYGKALRTDKFLKMRMESLYGFQKEEMSV
jgi:hypothetical protein